MRDVLRKTHVTLEAAGIPKPRLEAEVMAMNVVKMFRHDIFAQQEMELGDQQEQELAEIVERRLKREPLAYILGYREFYGVNLLVTPAVLIPRPETETLVEHALYMSLMGMETTELVIADVGTGTGAIAISLAIHLPAARIYALDISDDVLDVASYNIRAHNVSDRITLGKGDLLEPLPEPVDMLVANLPYIPSTRISSLQPEVQKEPRSALDGGADGLDLVRRLLTQAAAKLKEHGVILLEMDPEQIPVVEELARLYFPEASITVEQDLARQDRILAINRGVGEGE